jgi:calcineurin-like phosphoesterase family protein
MWCDMNEPKHYFIADCHYGHSNIHLKFRKEFSSQEEHNETIHQNILNTGTKADCLWLLGDIFFKESEFWRLKEYARKFQRVYYVLGNHDKLSVVKYALQFKNVTIMGVENRWGLWISHVPIPEYELYRGNSICGHLHNKQITREVYENGAYVRTEPDDRYFVVSCEQVNYTPISLDEIKQIRGWK